MRHIKGVSRLSAELRGSNAVLCVLTLAFVLSTGLSARADTYDFSFSGNGINSSGIITVAPAGTPGWYQITGINGVYSDTTDGISGNLPWARASWWI